MKLKLNLLTLFLLLISFGNFQQATACSSFKLQKGEKLVYGHNLNQGDLDVPGLIFINKRGIFKTGRTWREIFTKERLNSSSFAWISRYVPITFNMFGKDLPDGGMNEEGLFVWEMGDDTQYPKNKDLPKLNQMSWMQYILDNCRTIDEAVKTASEFEIDGWGWHFFVGDAQGNNAAIEFIGGKVVVHKGNDMPPGLFNEPYEREMEVLRYFKGFGGDYVPDLNDSKVLRVVKTAVMTRDYNPD
jgi:choloylglycine hydrolase